MREPAPSAVDTAELRTALEEQLAGRLRSPVARVVRRPSAYRTSFALEELEVRLEDGTTVELMFKDLGPGALDEEARRAKPGFLHDPLREIETYRTILAPAGIGPAFYGAAVDPEAGRHWLFVEKVRGVELWQVGEVETWQAVARWVAGMHARFSEKAEGLAGPARLLRYDADLYRRWMPRALEFGDDRARATLEPLAGKYEQVVGRLAGLPATVIHGEFYASNVLVRDEDRGPCPTDWEMAAVGPGLLDLAALTSGTWTEEERTALALAYREAAGPMSVPGGEDGFLSALDCCRLHLAVQWLGWSPSWIPPPEHRQDWLAEAARAAQRIGL